MSKHTPGPWIYRADFMPWGCIETEGGRRICDLDLPNKGGTIQTDRWEIQAKANGHLIAAAPELLKQLEKVANWLLGAPAIDLSKRQALFEEIQDAIDKAEGRS